MSRRVVLVAICGASVAGGFASRDSVASDAGQSATTEQTAGLEEVVVTAEKRAERLEDTPVPVTAISADSLVEQNLLRVEDYYTLIPGVNFAPNGNNNEAMISIRGLTTVGGNPVVGILIDDVPYGSSSGYAGGGTLPDIDPSDLARIEVLRGPQGTLYGASSIGGLIKFVTVDPSTEGVSARVQAGTSSVYNGPELGYNVRGMINMPLSDTVAVRASAFARLDPGYIDNVTDGDRGVNAENVDGGHLSALWRPSDTLSLKLSALVQEVRLQGSNNVDVGVPGVGDLQQNDLIGTGWHHRTVETYSATLAARIGSIDLTSVSGYGITQYTDSNDLTPSFGPYTQQVFGVTGTPMLDHVLTHKISQELRLSASVGRLDWLFGLFFTHENSAWRASIPAVNGTNGAVVGEWFDEFYPTTFAEYAAFADLTYHFTDVFDVQLGGRESKNRQTYYEIDEGPYIPFFVGQPSPLLTPLETTSDSSFTYLVTPRFKLSPNLMVYARVATGYRPGGPNPTATAFDLPTHFGPDTTENYEVGVKGDTANHQFSFDASVYYIDWKDIQLSLFEPVSSAAYFANASRAKSEGIELSTEWRPLAGTRIGAWGAWNEAVLTETFPSNSAAYGVAGDRLPDSARWSGHISLDQDFSITTGITGFAGGAVSYVGDRVGIFTGSPVRQIYPAYAQTDLHTGIRITSWMLNFYANNVFDRRGVVAGGIGSNNPVAFNYIQPRTIGLNVSTSFK